MFRVVGLPDISIAAILSATFCSGLLSLFVDDLLMKALSKACEKERRAVAIGVGVTDSGCTFIP